MEGPGAEPGGLGEPHDPLVAGRPLVQFLGVSRERLALPSGWDTSSVTQTQPTEHVSERLGTGAGSDRSRLAEFQRTDTDG